MMHRRLVGAAILSLLPLALGFTCDTPAPCAAEGKTFLGCGDWCIIYSLKGGGFHHNPEIPWGYSPKARTASTGKPKEVAVQKDTEAA